DPSFGAGGRVTVDVGRDDYAASVALGSDGKVVLGGGARFRETGYDFAVVRLLGDNAPPDRRGAGRPDGLPGRGPGPRRGLAPAGSSVGAPDDATLTATLRVAHGTLTLGTVAGLTVGGNGTSSVTLSGGLAARNAALASLLYRPALNYSGPDALSVTASDGL